MLNRVKGHTTKSVNTERSDSAIELIGVRKRRGRIGYPLHVTGRDADPCDDGQRAKA